VDTSRILAAAQDVQRAQAELAAAEARLEAVIGRRSPGRPKKGNPRGTVAQAVREALARGAMEFAEVAAKAGGNKLAVRSALKKGRARGEVKFAGGKYSLVRK
jgi:hypothetical protein